MRPWWVVVLVIALAVGCSDEDGPQAASQTTTSTIVASSTSTVASTSTTVVPTTVPPGCLDGPPPIDGNGYPDPYGGLEALGTCYHFSAVVEAIDIRPDGGGGYGCGALLAYDGPLVEDAQKFRVIDNVTSDCLWLDTAKAGDSVEVWTSLSASVLGTFLDFEGIKVIEAS